MPYTTLISASNLEPYVGDSNWVILDCRHDLADVHAGRNAFAAGHIPGAQFAHLDDDLSGPKVNASGVFCGRHPLPNRAAFMAKLRSWGVNDDTQIVTYDAHGGIFASRCWWLVRWAGHLQVAVLNGGLAAWSGVLSKERVTRAPGSISDKRSLAKSVNVDDVFANLQSHQMTVVDARSPERFRGENETMDKVGGHIPGAINRFYKDNLEVDGRFKSAQQLRADFSAIISHPEQAIMQCGSGVTACHNLLALEVAGMSGAALYAGSWSEWCADSGRPVASGG